MVMMTGDNRRTAEAVAAEVGVDAVYAEVDVYKRQYYARPV